MGLVGVEDDEGGTGYETDDIGEVVRGWWGGCAVGRVGEVDEMCEMSEVRCVCRCVCVGW